MLRWEVSIAARDDMTSRNEDAVRVRETLGKDGPEGGRALAQHYRGFYLARLGKIELRRRPDWLLASKGLGSFEDAESHFCKALELDPGYAWARVMRREALDQTHIP